MSLTDDELRGLVRDAIARAKAGRTPGGKAIASAPRSEGDAVPTGPVTINIHASHVLIPLGPGGDADGNCVIEPAVRCTHCGYCQSFGH